MCLQCLYTKSRVLHEAQTEKHFTKKEDLTSQFFQSMIPKKKTHCSFVSFLLTELYKQVILFISINLPCGSCRQTERERDRVQLKWSSDLRSVISGGKQWFTPSPSAYDSYFTQQRSCFRKDQGGAGFNADSELLAIVFWSYRLFHLKSSTNHYSSLLHSSQGWGWAGKV